MQVKVQAISELRREFASRRAKGGKGIHYTLLCLDCDTETPLKTVFEYVMTADEVTEYFGRLKERIVMLGISELRPIFGFNFQARGKMTVLSPLKPRVIEAEKRTA
jgi:hypothetical protein